MSLWQYISYLWSQAATSLWHQYLIDKKGIKVTLHDDMMMMMMKEEEEEETLDLER